MGGFESQRVMGGFESQTWVESQRVMVFESHPWVNLESESHGWILE